VDFAARLQNVHYNAMKYIQNVQNLFLYSKKCKCSNLLN